MRILITDDEHNAREYLKKTILQVLPDAEIVCAKKASEAEAELRKAHIDLAFLDIEMPGKNGLELLRDLNSIQPELNTIIVSAYPQYSRDALKLYVSAYLDKPVFPNDIKDALHHLRYPITEKSNQLVAQCFGYFNLFYNGKSVIFRRKQSMELLAYLIDRAGSVCTTGDIITALWDGDDTQDHSAYLRVLNSELNSTLSSIGYGNLIRHEHRQWAIDRSMLSCDYYRMLDGEEEAFNQWHGEYMVQYSWAEGTTAILDELAAKRQS